MGNWQPDPLPGILISNLHLIERQIHPTIRRCDDDLVFLRCSACSCDQSDSQLLYWQEGLSHKIQAMNNLQIT